MLNPDKPGNNGRVSSEDAERLHHFLSRYLYGGEDHYTLLRKCWHTFQLPESTVVVAVEKEQVTSLEDLHHWCHLEGAWFWDPLDGLIYLTIPAGASPGRVLLEFGIRHEVMHDCPQPAEWVVTMRQSVVALRRRRLKLRRKSEPTLQEENQLRDLALLQYHATEQWQPAVSTWLDCVLIRHSRKLHDIQWRLVQFLGLISLHHDGLGQTASSLMAMNQRLSKLADLLLLQKEFMEMLFNLKPLLLQSTRSYSPPVKKAMIAMRQRSRTSLSLGEIARAVGVSPEHLARRIKVETGLSFTESLQRLRVQEAIGQLAMTNDGLLEIASQCGFGSVEQFHRVFKRWMRQTPNHYRQALRKHDREQQPT